MSRARRAAGPTGACMAWNDPASGEYAIGSIRDSFLASLDETDPVRCIALARHLVSCGNPLPSATCAALGLPHGSSYGAGAQAVLTKASSKY